jgi:hypothetical protein
LIPKHEWQQGNLLLFWRIPVGQRFERLRFAVIYFAINGRRRDSERYRRPL